MRTPRRNTNSASKAIITGRESPIGEPLARFPHNVPELRTGGEPKRCAISASVGNSATTARHASVKETAAPISMPRHHGGSSQFGDRADVDNRAATRATAS